MKLDDQTDKQTDAYYDECLAFIRDHLLQFYQHYADDEGLSLNQVQGRVSKWDLAQWKVAIDKMDTTVWPEAATNRMKAYSVVAGIDKPHLLGAIIGIGLIRMAVKHQQAIRQRTKSDGEAEIKRMATAYNMTRKQQRKVSSVITQASTQELWSSNLWLDSDTLANDVENLVNKYLRHGMTLTDLQNLLNKHANPAQFKPNQSAADRIAQMQANTRRIVRTESARLVDEVNMTTYRLQGVKWVQFVCEPGACIKCQAIADAGPYRIEECPRIPDDTHPNCRCIKIPLTADSWPKQMTSLRYRILAKSQDDLSDAERNILWDRRTGYIQTVSSSSINDFVRGNTKGEIPVEYATTIQTLDRVIARHSLPKTVVTERYVGDDYLHGLIKKVGATDADKFIKALNDGRFKVTETGFTSTSLTSANIFHSHAVQLKILVPMGTHGFVTKNYLESEMILGHGLSYDILEAKKRTDTAGITLYLTPRR